ncbi:nucleotide sugar dehydrogenase [compost metagenome]
MDPYYLTHKAQSIGYNPEIILAGRRLNDSMGIYAASQLVKEMIRRRIHVDGARVLIMGLSFKENCPDLRNTRVIDIYKELQSYNVEVDVYDPWVNSDSAFHEYRLRTLAIPRISAYDGIIVAVAHNQFRKMGAEQIRRLGKADHVLFDLKNMFRKEESDIRL